MTRQGRILLGFASVLPAVLATVCLVAVVFAFTPGPRPPTPEAALDSGTQVAVFSYTIALPITLLAAALLLTVVGAFYIFHAARNAPPSLLWVALLLCAPPVAVPAYWWLVIWRNREQK